jgi:hypothetical protein
VPSVPLRPATPPPPVPVGPVSDDMRAQLTSMQQTPDGMLARRSRPPSGVGGRCCGVADGNGGQSPTHSIALTDRRAPRGRIAGNTIAAPRAYSDDGVGREIAPDRRRLVYEVKWDGYRAEAVKNGAAVSLASRNLRTSRSGIRGRARCVRSRFEAAVIDGEIVALDAEGRPSFRAPPCVDGGSLRRALRIRSAASERS